MIALGLALLSLDAPEERMSVLPPAERARRRFWRHDVFAYAACAVFALTVGLGAAARIHNWLVAKNTITTRRALAAEAAKRDAALDVLRQGNALRRDRLALLGAAANGGARLAGFLEHVRDSRPGPVVLSGLTYTAGDLNAAGSQPVVVLEGTVGPSVKTHYEVLDEFGRQLVAGPKKIIEEVSRSPDGSSLEFRLRIPLSREQGIGGAP